MVKSVKFGGSSLAGAGQFKKVKNIIEADRARRYVVPSAPGKRNKWDSKVTDMLYSYYDRVAAGQDTTEIRQEIYNRYAEIVLGLGVSFDLTGVMNQIHQDLLNGCGRDYAASRGEYVNGMIMARYLDCSFVDAAQVILFDSEGNFLPEETNEALKKRLSGLKRAVVPGFYGAMPDGTIKTFSRGGSDITGALVARAVSADVYENWTDVSGFLLADPRIVDNPVSIGTITYKELHELASMGACVLHEDAIYPVIQDGIPINIKNTNKPEDVGTFIVSSTDQKLNYEITGIAGKKDYCTLHIRKGQANESRKFDDAVLRLFEKNKISCEPVSEGTDAVSILIPQNELQGRERAVMKEIHQTLHPASISLESDLALVAVGGRGAQTETLVAGNVFSALEDANIHIRTVNQKLDDFVVLIGVQNRDFESAIRAIYNKFIKNDLLNKVSMNASSF